jgi:type II secretory pathway component PulF
VEVGLHSGDLPAGLVESSRLAGSIDQTQYAFRAALVYPLIVCGMAYVGLVAFCLFFVPTLERVSLGLRIPVGSALQVLQMLREALPYWVAIPPAMLLVWIAAACKARKRNGLSENLHVKARSWVPGMSRVVFQERCANYAETAVKLLDSGTALDESLKLAAESAGDPRLTSGTKTLVEAVSRGELPSDQSAEAKQFPPFLRWALWHSEPTVGRARALQMAADIYRQSAQRRAEKLQWIVPVVLSAVIGGTATLLFGLALFLPVVQLLEELAS